MAIFEVSIVKTVRVAGTARVKADNLDQARQFAESIHGLHSHIDLKKIDWTVTDNPNDPDCPLSEVYVYEIYCECANHVQLQYMRSLWHNVSKKLLELPAENITEREQLNGVLMNYDRDISRLQEKVFECDHYNEKRDKF